MTATAAPTLHILGVNDEQTTCDRCGKVELRGTVILGDENGEAGRYGTTCAGYMLGGRKVIRAQADTVEAVRRDRVYWALRSAHVALAQGDHRGACWIVTGLERDVILHRADEVEAVVAVRAKAREIRRAA